MAIIVKLSQLMNRRNLTLRELSERVGITEANLSRLRTGKCTQYKVSTLDVLCKALNCKLSDLIEYEEK